MSDDNPYRSSGQQFNRARYAQPQQTSVMAVVSLMCGIVSYPAMCLCFLSLPFAVMAIVSGHVARGTIRRSAGAYDGDGMAIAGLVLGYCNLLLMGLMLLFYGLASAPRPATPVPGAARPAARAKQGEVLLEQAEVQLVADTDEAIFGSTTCEHSAKDLAAHFVETLHIVDQTQFGETNPDAVAEPRAYRAFVQLNSDGAAFLLFVPEYARFTEAAKTALADSCWLIAQRSVDDLLPQDSELAVVLYSDQGCEQRMYGVTQRTGDSRAGLKQRHGKPGRLAEFFKLAKRQAPDKTFEGAEFDSQIDTKDSTSDSTFPAEAE